MDLIAYYVHLNTLIVAPVVTTQLTQEQLTMKKLITTAAFILAVLAGAAAPSTPHPGTT